MRSKIQDYFVKYIAQVSERKFILSWLTTVLQYPSINETFDQDTMKMTVKVGRFYRSEVGEIFEKREKGDRHYYVVTQVESLDYPTNEDGTVNDVLTLEYLGVNIPQPFIKLHNNIILNPGEMTNFKGPKPIVTSPGMMLLNQRLFVESFGDLHPYQEPEITVDDLDKLLVALLTGDKIDIKQAHDFQTNAYDIGFFGELCNKSFTVKSFTTHPDIPARRKERLDALTPEEKKDPIILAQLEKELGDMDKEYLKDDDARLFHDAQGGKSYDVHRKKMFIMVGAIPSFTDKGEASFSLIPQALTEGWTKESFPTIVNEIYKGSYDRGKETAKGGELTKYVLRVYQDLGITALDCESMKGSIIELLDNPKDKVNQQYLGRTLLKTGLPLTEEDLVTYAGKYIEIRDPLFCKTTNGVCYKCMGKPFEDIQETDIGAYILDVSSGIMMISMKNMHGTAVSTFNFNFEDFFVTT